MIMQCLSLCLGTLRKARGLRSLPGTGSRILSGLSVSNDLEGLPEHFPVAANRGRNVNDVGEEMIGP